MATDTVTASEIARLADVQRAVVTMWRKRSSGTALPFPTPTRGEDGRDRFDREAVLEWLRATGRHSRAADPRDHARLLDFDPVAEGLCTEPAERDQAIARVVATLALASQVPDDLAACDWDDAADLADEVDPDDRMLLREVVGARAVWPAVARYANRLAEACFSYDAAIDWLLTRAPREAGGVDLPSTLRTFVAHVVATLADEIGDAAWPLTVAETDRGGSALLRDYWSGPAADADLDILLDDADTAAARVGRCRALAAGRNSRDLSFDTVNPLEPILPARPVVSVAALPGPDHGDATPMGIVASVEALETALPDDALAVIVGPAAALCDPLAGAAGRVRDRLLRQSRLRAAVRLVGLDPARPHLSFGLWILGPLTSDGHRRDREIIVGCVDADTLAADSQAVLDDLRALAVDAHDGQDELRPPLGLAGVPVRAMAALEFRSVPVILTGQQPLTPTQPVKRRRTSAASLDLAAVGSRVQRLAGGVPGVSFITRDPTDSTDVDGRRRDRRPGRSTTLGALVDRRDVRVTPGVAAEIEPTPDGDVPLVDGLDELTRRPVVAGRALRSMVLAAGYRQRITESGDVIFVTTPKAVAWVDHAGGSLVRSPARILRISNKAKGICAEALAAQITEAAHQSTGRLRWRDWPVTLMPADAVVAAESGLRALSAYEEHLLALLTTVRELRQDAVTGATQDIITVVLDPPKEKDHATS